MIVTKESILEEISKDRMYIFDIIELSFEIKKLLRNNQLNFSDLINPSSRCEWENFAIMLPYLPIEIIEKNLDQLLEGFMDLNWPGSRVLYGYLCGVEINILKKSFSNVIHNAIELNDSDWIYFLLVFLSDDRVGLENQFTEEISLCKEFLASSNIDF
ncbi:hypothetical protein B9T33_14685 [Acinetobacter sp. ANC 5054]|uniref:DUF5071 domain-containing protein n=1 Tax=Acinetobacter sp. ANC 5054 TaxID=1977877 RepID=UPI000A33DD3E|nr:DUF5071 domain-containing protein [Acinetobacter sp. ANC 5054]OTG78031.1 hypothetical protein B9T33_14685 [Acinetobacter sp. ANC 5054]